MPSAQIAPPELTALFSFGVAPPTFELRENRCETTDMTGWRAAYVQSSEIREKLQKFLARIPVFMYVTDFREEALKHVIESLDTALFERVTGLTVDDFRLLSQIGLFNAQNMDSAIYQFRSFERASLLYATDGTEEPGTGEVGLWDHTLPS
jgi:hypothetical protein